MSSAGGWILSCTVCQMSCGSYLEWAKHLLGERHQDLSRRGCRQWNDDVKKCVIVAYAQLPVRMYGCELINALSCEAKGRFVTDYVVLVDRPRVAFVQFESMRKVHEIIPPGRAMTEIKVQNQRVQVKKALDIMDLEWNEFFPIERLNELKTTDRGTRVVSPQKRKLCEVDSPPTRPAKMNKMATGRIQTLNDDFSAQYKAICAEVIIPDAEYNKILGVVATLRASFQRTYPKSELYLYRHLYLQIRNTGTNELLIFLDTQDIWKEDWKVTDSDMSPEKEIIRHNNVINRTSSFLTKSGFRKLFSNEIQARKFTTDTCGTCFVHEATGVVFNLVTLRLLILETQTCRLLKYLCTFDPRAVRVMAVVHYWAIINGITFAVNHVTSEKYPFCGAEPVSLEWLVILFLCNRRVIPTVRQILERPHKKMIIANCDVGFSADQNFAEAWYTNKRLPKEGSEDFIKSVLSLVQQFFKFYSQLSKKTTVFLNTKDAEIIYDVKLLNFQTVEEQNAIRRNQAIIDNRKVTMLHPLCLSLTLSLSEKCFLTKNQELINITAQRLETISFYSDQTSGKDFIDLKSLLVVS